METHRRLQTEAPSNLWCGGLWGLRTGETRSAHLCQFLPDRNVRDRSRVNSCYERQSSAYYRSWWPQTLYQLSNPRKTNVVMAWKKPILRSISSVDTCLINLLELLAYLLLQGIQGWLADLWIHGCWHVISSSLSPDHQTFSVYYCLPWFWLVNVVSFHFF